MGKEKKTLFDELIYGVVVDLTEEEIDIIIALSDHKGHRKLDLEKSVKGSKKSGTYMYKVLDNLSSERFGDFTDSLTIQRYHVKDPMGLAHKILDERDAVSRYISQNMNKTWMKLIADTDPNNVELFLHFGVDEILSDVNLYNEERFRRIELSDYAKEIIKKRKELNEAEIRHLNRILIAEAYPNEIYKTKISLIHKSREGYLIKVDIRVFNFIIEHLKQRILYDKSEIEYLNAKVNNASRIFGSLYNKREDLFEINKIVKDGKYFLIFYKNRHDERMKSLWKFMTSNYVKKLKEIYGPEEISGLMITSGVFNFEEIDLIKFMDFLGGDSNDSEAAGK